MICIFDNSYVIHIICTINANHYAATRWEPDAAPSAPAAVFVALPTAAAKALPAGLWHTPGSKQLQTASRHKPAIFPETSQFAIMPSNFPPTLLAICTVTRTLWNSISHLRQNPLEPCLLSAPEPSGSSSAFCPGTLRNLSSHLHRNPPEPSLEPGVAAAPDRTRAILD